jgi:hypothetical protein
MRETGSRKILKNSIRSWTRLRMRSESIGIFFFLREYRLCGSGGKGDLGMNTEGVAQLMATNERLVRELSKVTEQMRRMDQSHLGGGGYGDSFISQGGYGAQYGGGN